MSTLAGYWGASDAAREVAALLAAQGTDSAAQARFGPLAMGRALRATLPEDAHDTGVVTLREGKGALVADVRLDNRPSLEGQMRIDPPLARTMSDTQVLALAIERWGESAVDRVIGDYAFAWWDAREQRLVLARDFLGARPLAFRRGEGSVAFGSRLDGGERVPPGHMLVLGDNGAALRRWWRPEPRELGLARDEEYAEALQEQLDAAVRARLRSTGGVGVLANGSLADAAVAGAAARLMTPARPVACASAEDAAGQGLSVLLAARLGAMTIGYAGAEQLQGALGTVAPLVPGLLKRAWQARRDGFAALDLAEIAEDAPAGLDVRDPSIDRRVVEFCISVPERQFLRGLGRRAFEAASQ